MDAPGQRYDARYLAGIGLFNAGEFWEAHEVWEGLWMDCPADERRFYQGLIQAAASFYHACNGNAAGADTLARRALAKLADYATPHLGLNLTALRTALGSDGPPPALVLDLPPEAARE